MTNKPISELIAEIEAAARSIESGYRQEWGQIEGDEGAVCVGTRDEIGDVTPFIEISIADWSGDDVDNQNLAKFIIESNPVNILCLIDHIAAIEQQSGEDQTPYAKAWPRFITPSKATEHTRRYQFCLMHQKRPTTNPGYQLRGNRCAIGD
ncbi:hypothetical protein ACS25C_03920 [Dickeya undicola]|uniref:hypothetical protein n=1 Tax=Dickeya undicola TaxID=1577887 RepID=UPI003F2435CE